MRFFLDRNISPAMADAIGRLAKAQGVEVVHLSSRFPGNTPDVEWILALRDEGWVIVSGDQRISRNVVERAAWHESGLTAFFLGDAWASKRFWVQASELVRWWPMIMDTAKACAPGSGYLLQFQAKEPRRIYEPEKKGKR